MERRPIFADIVVGSTGKPLRAVEWLIGKPTTHKIRNAVRAAQKFVFDAAAAERVGAAMAAYPEQIVTNAEFALPPHPSTWIEYPVRPFMDASTPTGISAQMDEWAGILLHNGRLYGLGGQSDGGWTPTPFAFDFHFPASMDDQLALAERLGCSRLGLLEFYWGASLLGKIDTEAAKRIRNGHRGFYIGPDSIGPQYWAEHKGHFAREVVNAIAFLLAMHQPRPIIEHAGVAHARSGRARGPAVYQAHSVITVRMGAPSHRLLDRPPNADRHSPRWHEVMGHFCHDRRARTAACSHADESGPLWTEYAPRKWECLACGGKRWWREYPNGRGDAARGFSSHHHAILG